MATRVAHHVHISHGIGAGIGLRGAYYVGDGVVLCDYERMTFGCNGTRYKQHERQVVIGVLLAHFCVWRDRIIDQS